MNGSSILLVGNYSNRTGYAWNNIYRLFNVIAKAMHARGVSVCLSFAVLEPPVEFIEKNVPFDVFEFDPNNITLRALYSLAKAIRKHRIRYVYLTDLYSYSGVYFLLRSIGVSKIILHSRVSVADPYPARPERGIRRIVKASIGKIRWLTPNRIYTVSDFVRNRLIHKHCLPGEKVITILNGIDIERFRCDDLERKSDTVRIFTGARAEKYKGILYLIRAVSLLVNDNRMSDFVVEYAGDGPDLEEYKREVQRRGLEGKFVFLGQLKDTRDAVCAADIVVVPSAWGDACPSSVSEALAAGKPLITTSAGGIPEIVGDSANAVLVPPSDEKALAYELAALIEDSEKRTSLGSNARRRAEAALDERDYYERTIERLVSDLF